MSIYSVTFYWKWMMLKLMSSSLCISFNLCSSAVLLLPKLLPLQRKYCKDWTLEDERSQAAFRIHHVNQSGWITNGVLFLPWSIVPIPYADSCQIYYSTLLRWWMGIHSASYSYINYEHILWSARNFHHHHQRIYTKIGIGLLRMKNVMVGPSEDAV